MIEVGSKQIDRLGVSTHIDLQRDRLDEQLVDGSGEYSQILRAIGLLIATDDRSAKIQDQPCGLHADGNIDDLTRCVGDAADPRYRVTEQLVMARIDHLEKRSTRLEGREVDQRWVDLCPEVAIAGSANDARGKDVVGIAKARMQNVASVGFLTVARR